MTAHSALLIFVTYINYTLHMQYTHIG